MVGISHNKRLKCELRCSKLKAKKLPLFTSWSAQNSGPALVWPLNLTSEVPLAKVFQVLELYFVSNSYFDFKNH